MKKKYVYIHRDAQSPLIYGVYESKANACSVFSNGHEMDVPSYEGCLEAMSKREEAHVYGYHKGTSIPKSILIKQELL